MLSAEENELLTRVGPGTPMGMVFRRYWLPALLSAEVAEPDGDPVQVGLLGERLVAFRATDGTVGLLQENCPHRNASLWYGRNEEGGLRCIYHGWKWGTDGRCVDLPTEPAERNFRDKVRARAYPTREAAGVVWTYLGPRDKTPPFREFRWLQVHPHSAKEFKILEECNYLQAIEGGLDLAHGPILHSRISWRVLVSPEGGRDLAPRSYVEFTKYGLRFASVETATESTELLRTIPFILPSWTLVPPFHEIKGERVVNGWIPRDDVSTWHYQYLYNPDGPIDIPTRVEAGGWWVDADYRKVRNMDNRYLQDRRMTKNVSGMEGIVTQDHAVNESQGPILDRTTEHLGTTDVAVIAMRRVLLDVVHACLKGEDLPALDASIEYDRIISETLKMPRGTSWQTASPLGPGLALDRPTLGVRST